MALFIGLMSGTSVDGIDAVLVDFNEHGCQMLGHCATPFSPALQQQIHRLSLAQQDDIEQVADCELQLAEHYSRAVSELLTLCAVKPSDIVAIGNHGQTVRHRPNAPRPYTIQLGCNTTLAMRSGIDVIADFRTRDIALGGQGAPLVPVFHRYLFGADDFAVVNIGGIANVTLLSEHAVLGFDCGPGNTLLDAICAREFACAYDANGALARQGQVDSALLALLLSEPYLAAPPPKSTGRELFNPDWLASKLTQYGASVSRHDLLATLTEFTAKCISQSLQHASVPPKQILLCGGGAFNSLLVERITALTQMPVKSCAEFGVDPQHMEAMAFAYLAYCYVHRIPSNLPSVTGASRAVPLGNLFAAF